MKQLNYPGDRTSDICGQIVGPSLTGEFFTIVAADYDALTNQTSAHLRPTTDEEFAAEVARLTPPVAFGGRA